MDILISVIVPIYKVEKYITKCIDSIVNQTYKNIEIILVDDGSPDNCGHICDEYAKKDSRIMVIHKQNGGLSSARNAGLDVAKGQYICFIDSDDYMDEKYIEIMAKNIEQVDIVACDFKYVYEVNGNYSDSCLNVENEILEKEKVMLGLFDKKHYLILTVAWNKLYKKTIFDNLRYTEGIIHEDEDIAYKILDKCNKIKVIKDKLYYYLQRESSIMGSINVEKRLVMIDIYKRRTDFFVKKGYSKKIIDLAYYTYISTCLYYIKQLKCHEKKDKAEELENQMKKIKDKNYKKMSVILKVKLFIKSVLLKIRH